VGRKSFFMTILMLLSVLLLLGMTKPLLAEPTLNGNAAVLLDPRSGQVIWEKNRDEKLHPASITKILTAIMAIESGKLNDIVTVSGNPPRVEGTRVYLEVGERITLRELVQAALIHSANDAALAIAEYLGGTEENFAQTMNKRAQELGALNSNFLNAHGLSEEGHYTTAYDMALISSYAISNGVFREIVETKVLPWEGKAWQANLINKNQMLWSYEGANGVKTGYTSEAKCTIVVSATRKGQTYLAVVLGSLGNNTWTDAEELLDYGFDNFQTLELTRPNEVIATLVLDQKNELELVAEKEFALSLPQSGNKQVESRLALKPIGHVVAKGQVVGEKIYSVNGQDVGAVNLVAKEQIKVTNLFNIIAYLIAGVYLLQIFWRIVKQWRNNKRNRNMFASSPRRLYRDF